MSDDSPLWYDVRTKIEIENGNHGCRNHVWTQQSFETHATSKHGDDFRITGQLRSEEYDGNKNKEGAEQIGKVGDEIGIIIEHYSAQRGVICRKFSQILIDVKDDGNGYDKDDGIYIRTYKFTYYISVDFLYVCKRIEHTHYPHCL